MSQLIEAIKAKQWDTARGLINGDADVKAVDKVSVTLVLIGRVSLC
jgi:hypothetical protein